MMLTVQTLACLAVLSVFVVSSYGQDYAGRPRFGGGFGGDVGMVGGGVGPIVDPGFAGNGLMALQGGGMGMDPGFVNGIIGSTVAGRPLRAGDVLPDGTTLPRHGGVRDPSGLSNGWGADVNSPMAQDGWTDPLRGMAWPSQYNGEELEFDRAQNRFVIAQHNAAKASGGALGGVISPDKGGSLGSPLGIANLVGGSDIVHDVNKAGASGLPAIGSSPIAANIGHNTAKAAVGQAAAVVDQQTWGGVSRGDPIANQVAANLAQDSLHVAKKTVGMASANQGFGGIAAGKPGILPIGGIGKGIDGGFGKGMVGQSIHGGIGKGIHGGIGKGIHGGIGKGIHGGIGKGIHGGIGKGIHGGIGKGIHGGIGKGIHGGIGKGIHGGIGNGLLRGIARRVIGGIASRLRGAIGGIGKGGFGHKGVKGPMFPQKPILPVKKPILRQTGYGRRDRFD